MRAVCLQWNSYCEQIKIIHEIIENQVPTTEQQTVVGMWGQERSQEGGGWQAGR